MTLSSIKAVYSLVRLIRDPNRLDDVFEMANSISSPEIVKPIIERLMKQSRPAHALAARHRLRLDLPALAKLPPRSLGREFAEHMKANNLDPSAIPTLPGDTTESYLRAHLYETHDVWHVVTGFGTDFIGELGLQGFYLAQIPGPLPSLLLAAGYVRGALVDRTILPRLGDTVSRGYAMGKAAEPLFGVRWDDLWSEPLADVRRRFGLAGSDSVGASESVPAAA